MVQSVAPLVQSLSYFQPVCVCVCMCRRGRRMGVLIPLSPNRWLAETMVVHTTTHVNHPRTNLELRANAISVGRADTFTRNTPHHCN